MEHLTGFIHCNKISIEVGSGGGGNFGAFLIAVMRFLVASLTESFHSASPPAPSTQAPTKELLNK